jgi:O-antigen ligase
MAVRLGVERPGSDARWVALPLLGLAPALGALAVVSPGAAIAGVAGLLFAVLAFYDLAAGVALFAALVFFEHVPGAGGASLGVKAGGLILVLAALRRSGTPFLLKEHPLVAYTAALLAAWALASSLWAVDVSRAASDGFRLMLGIGLVFIVFAAVRQPGHLRLLMWGYLCGATAAAVFGFVGPSGMEADRLAGSVGDPNILAAMLVPALVFAVFALGWTEEPAKRWLLGGGIVLFTIALYLTQSRGGLVALAAAFAAAALFGGPVRRYVVPTATVVVCVGLVYYAAFASSYAVERLTNPGRGTGRADLWSVATEVIADHPLVGVGAGNFPVVAPQYAAESVNLPAVHQVVDTPKVAHNTYLGVFADLGVVGLVGFLLVVLGALTLTVRATRTFARAGDRELELQSRAVLVALVGILTAFVFLSGQYEKQLWLLIGLGIALHALARRRTRGSANS